MRLFNIKGVDEAVSLIQDCYSKCTNREKLDMQDRYFQNEIANLSSANKAHAICKNTMMSLQVSPQDIEIITDGFPTIAQVVSASDDVMKRYSPADVNSIELITTFFHTATSKVEN